MTPTYTTNCQKYIDLMESFIAKTMTAAQFRDLFMSQHDADRDAQEQHYTPYQKARKTELIHKGLSDSISSDEFESEWWPLLGYSEIDVAITDILCRVYGDCNVYWENLPKEESGGRQKLDRAISYERGL